MKRKPKPGESPRKRAALAAFAICGNKTQSAKLAGVTYDRFKQWVKEDPKFAAAVEQASEEAADRLEEEARRRAEAGYDEPVFFRGEQCGVIRRYSDNLLIFLLKACRPQKFRETYQGAQDQKGETEAVSKYDSQLAKAWRDRHAADRKA
jgi:hypothetical protein